MEKTSQHYWTKQVCPLIYSHDTFGTNRRFLYYLHQLVINIHGSSVSFPRQKLKSLKNWLFSKLGMAPIYAVKSYDLKKVWDGLSSTSPKEILKLLALLSIQDRTDLACSCMEKKVTHWRHFNGAPPWCSRGWSTPLTRRPRELDTFNLENNWIWRRHKSNFPVPMRSTLRWLCQALHSGQVAKGQKTMALSWNKRLRLDIRNFHTMRTIKQVSQKGCAISTPGLFQMNESLHSPVWLHSWPCFEQEACIRYSFHVHSNLNKPIPLSKKLPGTYCLIFQALKSNL